MFNPLQFMAPYDGANQFINNLQAYNASKGTDEMLDLIREIQQSGNYYFEGYPFPESPDILVGGGITLSGTIQVPPGSYVTSIQFYNDYEENPEGFIFKLFDKGTRASIFYTDYSFAEISASNMQQQVGVGTSNPPTNPGVNGDDPFGPNYLLSPLIITPPGILGWEIASKGVLGTEALMQVLVCCAIPVSKLSIGQKVVSRNRGR